MAKAGKILGLISPALAVGIVALMLFVPSYSYQSASCKASYGRSSEECTYESGTVSAFRYAIEEGDTTLFYWAGFIIAVCLAAAVGALAGKAAPAWVCAVVLWILTGLGMMSIGLFVFPLAVVLFASATFLTVAWYESRTHSALADVPWSVYDRSALTSISPVVSVAGSDRDRDLKARLYNDEEIFAVPRG